MPEAPLLEMRNITKTFPGIIANDNVSLQLNAGEIHVLLGENGAGKSTLMSVLSGLYRPDAGDILLRGKRVVLHSPKDAIANGIGMIHQNFKLVSAFTVAQNIVLGAKDGLLTNDAAREKEIAAFAQTYHMPVQPGAKVWQLSVGEQQRVEILKILYRKADILVLDEPTSALTPQEVVRLFDALRATAALGKAVVVITHKLPEVMDIADRVTILRAGKRVEQYTRPALDIRMLTEKMIGTLVTRRAPEAGVPGVTALKLDRVSARNDRGLPAVRGITLGVREGEILGIAGVAGNGQKELLEVIAGLRTCQSGEIIVGPESTTPVCIQNTGVNHCIKAGVSFVPEDRLGMGLVGNMSLVDNMVLRSEIQGFWLPYHKLEQQAAKAAKEHGIPARSLKSPVRLLSGGNLQKALVAREIARAPKVLLVAYPVRGLDIAAANKVFSLLLEQRKRGCAIVMVSEDLDQLLYYSDRIAVLYAGNIVGCIPKSEADPQTIGLLMMGEGLPETEEGPYAS